MELLDEQEFDKYIRNNYQLIFTNDSSKISQNEAGHCDFCKKDVYLKIGSRWNDTPYSKGNLPDLTTFFIQCPSCQRQSFIMTVVLARYVSEEGKYLYDYFKIYNLPTKDSQFETKDIPDKYDLLKKTVNEAKYNLQHGQFMSATIMFRRALQILAKNILGAKGRTLFKQLEWLKANENDLKVNLTELFHDNSKLIREVGNQGAHPDDDEELQEFSEEDANTVHDLFLILVNEIFVLPTKMKAMKEELTKRRKLKK
ncbi:DUF4145 domain-containing protein [Aestuariivivens sediminicola]|uniref:DUF4145 domain-containing protein n=1 Tax=Aestuariivivens sediminicola TaxID=2913560 RepID=UPI001F56958E|nr:DUF4145 domain-containing protein [Aestuariivivens sediminicola]